MIVFAERFTPHILLQSFEVFVSGRSVHEYFGTRPRLCFLSRTGMKALENITSLTAFTQVSPLSLSSLCSCFFPPPSSSPQEILKRWKALASFSLSLLTFIMSLFTFPVYMPEGRAPPEQETSLWWCNRALTLSCPRVAQPWNTMHHFSFQPHCSVAFWHWHDLHKAKLDLFKMCISYSQHAMQFIYMD